MLQSSVTFLKIAQHFNVQPFNSCRYLKDQYQKRGINFFEIQECCEIVKNFQREANLEFSWDEQAKVVGALVSGGFSGDFLMMERYFPLFGPFQEPFKDFKNCNTFLKPFKISRILTPWQFPQTSFDMNYSWKTKE